MNNNAHLHQLFLLLCLSVSPPSSRLLPEIVFQTNYLTWNSFWSSIFGGNQTKIHKMYLKTSCFPLYKKRAHSCWKGIWVEYWIRNISYLQPKSSVSMEYGPDCRFLMLCRIFTIKLGGDAENWQSQPDKLLLLKLLSDSGNIFLEKIHPRAKLEAIEGVYLKGLYFFTFQILLHIQFKL